MIMVGGEGEDDDWLPGVADDDCLPGVADDDGGEGEDELEAYLE